MKKAHRTPWIKVEVQVCFEDTTMEVLVRNRVRETREIMTPVFRLPDGTEFTGRRMSDDLRVRILKAASHKKVDGVR